MRSTNRSYGWLKKLVLMLALLLPPLAVALFPRAAQAQSSLFCDFAAHDVCCGCNYNPGVMCVPGAIIGFSTCDASAGFCFGFCQVG